MKIRETIGCFAFYMCALSLCDTEAAIYFSTIDSVTTSGYESYFISQIDGSGVFEIPCVTNGYCGTHQEWTTGVGYHDVATIVQNAKVGGISSYCKIDPRITAIVLPTNAFTIKSDAFYYAANVTNIVVRGRYSFSSHNRTETAYSGTDRNTIFFSHNNSFRHMSTLETVWIETDLDFESLTYTDDIVDSGLFRIADSIHVQSAYQKQWIRMLRNCGYGGRIYTYTGTWPDVQDMEVEGGARGIVSITTNYVYSTSYVTNHVYHHDVVTDMTAYHTTVTNVHVHYVNESQQSGFLFPASSDTGFINVVAEVKGGFAVIPATWSVNYPGFTEKYGSDFSKALSKPNGKYDRSGNPMYVWQDYVAGTSPMDVNDCFDATIAIVDGEVVVSHAPVLDAERAALRKYTTWGKKNLLDSEWKEVEAGHELEFNFYKVTVEMK